MVLDDGYINRAVYEGLKLEKILAHLDPRAWDLANMGVSIGPFLGILNNFALFYNIM